MSALWATLFISGILSAGADDIVNLRKKQRHRFGRPRNWGSDHLPHIHTRGHRQRITHRNREAKSHNYARTVTRQMRGAPRHAHAHRHKTRLVYPHIHTRTCTHLHAYARTHTHACTQGRIQDELTHRQTNTHTHTHRERETGAP